MNRLSLDPNLMLFAQKVGDPRALTADSAGITLPPGMTPPQPDVIRMSPVEIPVGATAPVTARNGQSLEMPATMMGPGNAPPPAGVVRMPTVEISNGPPKSLMQISREQAASDAADRAAARGAVMAPSAALAQAAAQQPGTDREVDALLAAQRAQASGAQPSAMQLDPDLNGIAPQPQYIPAGWNASRDPYRKENLDSRVKAQEARTQADTHELAAYSAGKALEAEELQAHADKMRQFNDDSAIRQANQQRAYADKRRQLEQLDDVATNGQVDPSRIFSKASTGTKIMMLIGGALGGYLQGAHGGPNPFIQTMERIQDEDINAQKFAIHQAGAKADRVRSQLQELRDQIGDDNLAEDTMRMRTANYMETRIKAIASNTQSEAIKANAMKALGDLDAWKAEFAMARDARTWRAAQLVGGAAQPKVEDSRLVHAPNGDTRIAPDEVRAREAQNKVNYYHQLGVINDRALSTRKEMVAALKSGDLTTYRVKEGLLKELQADRQTIKSQAQGQGVITKSDAERDEKYMVDYTKIDLLTPGATDRTIDETSKYWQKRGDDELNLMAPERAQRGYKYAPNGALTPTKNYTGQSSAPARSGAPSTFKKAGGQ